MLVVGDEFRRGHHLQGLHRRRGEDPERDDHQDDQDEGKNEPSNLELTGRRLVVQTYCQTVGSPDAKISQAPHL